MSRHPPSDDLIAVAERIASDAHAGQVDKLGVPYIEHVRAVAQAVRPLGGAHRIVALLHDSLEDCDDRSIVSMTLLTDAFGAQIAASVDAMTKRPGEDYERDYVPRVLDNPVAAAVKRADVSHNLGRLHLLEAGARARLRPRYEYFLRKYDDLT